jgi:hypothetical protein
MTSERSRAYTRVMKTVEDVGPAKLHELEQRRVRTAADTLLFAAPGEYAAFRALDDVQHLMSRLVGSSRWTAERANSLVADLAACGPGLPDVFPTELAA